MAPSAEESHIYRCKNIFITWTWATILMSSLFIGGVSLAWAGARQLSTIESKTSENRHKIDQLERLIIRTDEKLDRILEALDR